MVTSGRQGPWQPRGSGLLGAVIVLSVVALLVHGGIALVLLRGASHAAAAGPVATSTSTPSASGGSASATPGPATLHLDHACLVSDNPPTTAKIPDGDPFGSDLSDLGDKAELQRLYSVKGGQLSAIDGAGATRSCDQQLWRIVLAAMPAKALPYIDELLVFDADVKGNSSGLYVGEVLPKDADSDHPDPAHWRLALAPNGSSDLSVAITVAHEVGHLLSLNRGQLTGQSEQACPGLYIDTGCLNDDSVLLAFLDDLWPNSTWKAFDDANSEPDDAKRDKALHAFYEAHAAEFVDEYAATYPSEDFAESFAVWCAIGPQSPLLPDVIEGDAKNGAAKVAWFDKPGNTMAQQTATGCEALRALTR